MNKEFEKIIEKLEEYKYENLLEHDYEQAQHCKDIGDCGMRDCVLCVFDKAIEIVKQKAEKFGTDIKAGSNGWIPVEEELPKTDKYILLSFSNFSIPCVGRYEEDENGGAFYVGDDYETCVSQGMFVNAWMNLPAPYQPKGE